MSGQLEYLLDMNVLSETRKKQANERVMSFLLGADASALFISVLSLGELRKGVAMKQRADAQDAYLLGKWVDGLELSFGDRMLGVDAAIAKQWGNCRLNAPDRWLTRSWPLLLWSTD